MCGIAGFMVKEKPDFDMSLVIKDMSDSMAHRGPDDMGCMVIQCGPGRKQSYIALGHRRLKIIDLSRRSHQPMGDPKARINVSYNGEIYNYIELREELLKKGRDFLSTGDTEVVLRAYEEWGAECFKRFNGMWAIAIFDERRKMLILSRDRFGKKPLYYYRTGKEIVFASEIKALLRYPKIKKRPNMEKVFRYIARHYRYTDIDHTSYFENIYQVPKSSYLEIDESLGMKEIGYWELDPAGIKAI